MVSLQLQLIFFKKGFQFADLAECCFLSDVDGSSKRKMTEGRSCDNPGDGVNESSYTLLLLLALVFHNFFIFFPYSHSITLPSG